MATLKQTQGTMLQTIPGRGADQGEQDSLRLVKME